MVKFQDIFFYITFYFIFNVKKNNIFSLNIVDIPCTTAIIMQILYAGFLLPVTLVCVQVVHHD